MLNKTWNRNVQTRILILGKHESSEWQAAEQRNKLQEMVRTKARIKLRTIKEFVSIKEPGVMEPLESTDESSSDCCRLDDHTFLAPEYMKYNETLNAIIKKHSENTAFVFLQLPQLPSNRAEEKVQAAYLRGLAKLVRGLPPTAMVATG